MEKSDAKAFREQLTKLEKLFGQRDSRRGWVKYLFHFTQIENIPEILKSGKLFSRGTLQEQRINFSDTASGEVLSKTSDKWKHYVRFYFRPKTPMLYNVEGIRPKPNPKFPDAHSSVPVYLLFDIEPLICRADSRFTNGNLARGVTKVFDPGTAEEFSNLPFKDIYHNSWFLPEDKERITNCRHAEVIIPDEIDLDDLAWIWCRSAAEYETLKSLLPTNVWQKWRSKVQYGPEQNLFNLKWLHVTSVNLTEKLITFTFNPPAKEEDYGPFHLKVEITNTSDGNDYEWEQKSVFYDKDILEDGNLKMALRYPLHSYRVQLLINDHLAYQNSYTYIDDIPF